MKVMSRFGVALLALGACGTATPAPGPLNRAALRVSNPRTIISVVSSPAAFEGHTSGSVAWALFGPLGLLMKQSMAEGEGQAVTRTVYDPANAISADLVKRLSTRFTLKIVERPPLQPVPPPKRPSGQSPKEPIELDSDQPLRQPVVVGSNADKLMDENRDVDLVLNVATVRWGFAPVRLERYGINYEGLVRLLDTRTRTVIAEGTCTSLPIDSPDAPNYDQMLANDAAIVRAMMKSLEDYCIDDYRKRILGLYGE